MKFVLASQNPHKLVEMQEILSAHGVEAVLQSELGIHVDVEETGETFAANAMLKAKAVMEASGLPAIADDSGVCVDALNGAPGVYSARYGGPELDDVGRYRLLLANMRGFAPQGDGGFGYDPVFFLPELRTTYAQLTPEEKASVSHRGKALEVFDGKLRDYLKGKN